MWVALFQTLCVSTTSGFGIADNAMWPSGVNGLLIGLAVMCGCAGSTSGGLKVDRVVLIFKALGRRMGSILHPSSVNEIKVGKRILRDEEVAPHLLYTVIYLLLIAVSIALCLLVGVDDQNAIAASITSVSNVGPALGALGTMGNFNSVPILGKMIFTFDMFLGRVEIYPVLAVVAMVFDRRNH